MAKIHPMQSMELDDEAQFEAMPAMVGMDKPRYPYGLKISLENEQLKALGIDCSDCKSGGIVHLHALARITSVSQQDMEGGKRERIELQIEEMCCVESEDRENEEAEERMSSAEKRKKLYDHAD